MLDMIVFFVVLAGLAFGSCISLISYRLPRGERLGMTRSACPCCTAVLPVRSLVPVLSWLLQRGRCHACRVAIHWRYPLIELATAGGFLAAYETHGAGGAGLLLMGLTFALMVMIVVDFEHTILPDEMQVLAATIAIPYHWLYGMHIADQLLGGAIGGAVGWGLQAGYKRLRGRDGLGTGDVKFLIVAGLWLGPTGLVPLFLLSGILGVVTALVWRLRSSDPLFPFGPALAFSLWLLVLWPVISRVFWTWPEQWLALS